MTAQLLKIHLTQGKQRTDALFEQDQRSLRVAIDVPQSEVPDFLSKQVAIASRAWTREVING